MPDTPYIFLSTHMCTYTFTDDVINSENDDVIDKSHLFTLYLSLYSSTISDPFFLMSQDQNVGGIIQNHWYQKHL